MVFELDFRIQARGGLKFHLKRPRNPLTNFGGLHGKARGRIVGLGPSDPGLDCGKARETGLSLGPIDQNLHCSKV